MGFLTDVGRSGGLRRLTSQYTQGQDALLGTALKVRELQNQNRALTMKEQKFSAEMEKIKREEEEYNRPLDVDMTTPVLAAKELYPNNPEEVDKVRQRVSIATGAKNGMTTAGAWKSARPMLADDDEYLEGAYKMAQMKAEARLGQITKKGNKATPEELAEADSIRNQWSAIKDKKLKRDAAKKELELKEQKFDLDAKRAEEVERHNKAMESISKGREARLSKEEEEKKTDVKDSEIRLQLKEMLGLSDFLEKTMNPEIRAEYTQAASLASQIAANPPGFELPSNARAGAIAARALEIVRIMMKNRPPIESFQGK
jgi:hypothetical protein